MADDTPTERSGPKGCRRPRPPGRPGGALPTSWLRGWPPAAGRRPRPRGPASRVAAGGPARAAERGDPTGGAVPAAYRHRQPALGIGTPTILDALAEVHAGSRKQRPVLERAYNICSDLSLVAATLVTQGMAAVEAM